MVMVSEGAKLSNVCKNEFIFAAACWDVWMKRKKKQFNLQFLIELLKDDGFNYFTILFSEG